MSGRNRSQGANKTEPEKKDKGGLPKKDFYTVKEVAGDRGFSVTTVRSWHERGIVDFQQPGGPGGEFKIPRAAYLKLCGESTV